MISIFALPGTWELWPSEQIRHYGLYISFHGAKFQDGALKIEWTGYQVHRTELKLGRSCEGHTSIDFFSMVSTTLMTRRWWTEVMLVVKRWRMCFNRTRKRCPLRHHSDCNKTHMNLKWNPSHKHSPNELFSNLGWFYVDTPLFWNFRSAATLSLSSWLIATANEWQRWTTLPVKFPLFIPLTLAPFHWP